MDVKFDDGVFELTHIIARIGHEDLLGILLRQSCQLFPDGIGNHAAVATFGLVDGQDGFDFRKDLPQGLDQLFFMVRLQGLAVLRVQTGLLSFAAVFQQHRFGIRGGEAICEHGKMLQVDAEVFQTAAQFKAMAIIT